MLEKSKVMRLLLKDWHFLSKSFRIYIVTKITLFISKQPIQYFFYVVTVNLKSAF